jgi:hypothetical protein
MSDFYAAPQGKPLGFTLGDIAGDRSRALEDFIPQQYSRTRDFNRGTNDMVNRFSGQGAARSGAHAVAQGRMLEDYNNANAEGQRYLTRTLDSLDRQRRLATLGVLS